MSMNHSKHYFHYFISELSRHLYLVMYIHGRSQTLKENHQISIQKVFPLINILLKNYKRYYEFDKAMKGYIHYAYAIIRLDETREEHVIILGK